MDTICALVLAAGDGKRMKSRHPKVLCEVLFKPMLRWVTDSIAAAGIDDVCAVVAPDADEVLAVLPKDCATAVQANKLGTGHAVMMAVAFAATVAVLVLFFADGQFSPGRAESAARARGVSGLAGFAEKYGLTPRETDVLAAALYNDKAPKEIAYDLQISERIVQRYFNSIYEKTGTQGRVGLTLLYSGFTINED